MKKVARYILENELSRNGPVSVFTGRHEVLGRQTLLKVYSGGDDALIQRFEQEARIVANFEHPSIVSIYDYGQWEDTFFIAMEYVNGWNLAEYLDKETLGKNQKKDLCFKIAQAVSVIHRNGFVHRDLKPENIMVTTNNKIKLTDFGISLQQSMARTTSSGTLIGTPLYMSPEQINNLELTPASDIFSLGIVFYEIWSETNPFEAAQYGEIFANILTKTVAPLNSLGMDIPDWCSELVEQMLIKEPEDRLKSADDVLSRFPQQVEPKPTAEPVKQHESMPEKPAGIKVRYAIAILLALFMMIALLRYYESLIEIAGWKESTAGNENLITPDTTAQNDSLIARDKEQDIKTADSTTNGKVQLNHQSADTLIQVTQIDTTMPTTFYINTFPWCKIYLNYEYLDTVPMDSSIHIEPGRYLLSLRHPDYIPTWSDSISIKAHQNNAFAFNLDTLYYRLNLDVHPWGKVFIGDRYIGDTPLSKPLLLSRRDHKITIRNDYYQTWEDTVRWKGEPVIAKRIVLRETE